MVAAAVAMVLLLPPLGPWRELTVLIDDVRELRQLRDRSSGAAAPTTRALAEPTGGATARTSLDAADDSDGGPAARLRPSARSRGLAARATLGRCSTSGVAS